MLTYAAYGHDAAYCGTFRPARGTARHRGASGVNRPLIVADFAVDKRTRQTASIRLRCLIRNSIIVGQRKKIAAAAAAAMRLSIYSALLLRDISFPLLIRLNHSDMA